MKYSDKRKSVKNVLIGWPFVFGGRGMIFFFNLKNLTNLIPFLSFLWGGTFLYKEAAKTKNL